MRRYKRKLHFLGNKSTIINPLRIDGAERISLGNNVRIGSHCWLAAMPLTSNEKCELVFQDGSTIGDFNHVYATGSIVFEKNALTANYVYISDNLHSFEDIHNPICDQPIKQLNSVVIGEGCWIGEHVSIIGASVGKHSIVGSNAVVTHDIPDYCVAVGVPAVIIKRYDKARNKWVRTTSQGDFLE